MSCWRRSPKQVDRDKGQGRARVGIRAIKDRINEVTLRTVDGTALKVFKRVGDVPAIARPAPDPLEGAGTAAALGRGATGQAQLVPVQIFAQHDVDHTGDRV